MVMTRKQREEEGFLTEEELKEEETKYKKMKEKEIEFAAISMWNDIIQACSKEEETNCNCVIDNLNAMSYLTPVGKNTQTRKIFNGMLTQFDIFKNKQLLTNCTKKLRPI